ncbi:hypothetical protein [Paraflavitalea sp. CAU 1676]|uniref:hypothetical protein n=1 Tax=Paraflavitalea sp. CAU 1676 TaxID=3032598 RepID=UPI0023DBC341|nr:hypothetical protein [Paraflavitalea sp. CAU 1676]MDF2191495.1 hypothetical protein [Paraflavitalea sp. CAU 1676]
MKNVSSLFFVVAFQFMSIVASGQVEIDTAIVTNFADVNGAHVLQYKTFLSSLNKSDCYFKIDGCLKEVGVVFSTGNKSCSSFQATLHLMKDRNHSDSTTLLVLFYYDEGVILKDYKVLLANDKACLASFNRKVKLDKSFLASLKVEAKKLNRAFPLVLFKEWSCRTTSLFSGFD